MMANPDCIPMVAEIGPTTGLIELVLARAGLANNEICRESS
jgi:hypothetical protein